MKQNHVKFEFFILKENVRNSKNLNNKYLIKYYVIQEKVLLKNPLFMYISSFICVVSHLEIHAAVHINTLKAKRKAY